MSQYAHGPTRRAAQTSSGRSRTRPTDYRGGRRRSGRPVALGVTAPMGEMMDRFAATLLAMLVTAPASAQVMVDGPHLQETCKVRRAACAGFIGATVDALAPLHEFCIPPVTPPPRLSNAPSISCAVARTRSAATPASSRSSSRLRPSGHAPLRGPAWASPSIRAQGRAFISASILPGAPSPKSGDAYRCRPWDVRQPINRCVLQAFGQEIAAAAAQQANQST
jgi:hypothetical protein